MFLPEAKFKFSASVTLRNHLPSLSLGFLICKTGSIAQPHRTGSCLASASRPSGSGCHSEVQCGVVAGVVLLELTPLSLSHHRTKLVLENLEDACVLSGPDDSLCDKHACPAYVGPEILSSRPSYSGKAADVWSLGVVLFTMLAGHYPFQDSEPILLFGKIRRGVFVLPAGLSAPACCLIRCLLRREPAERLTAAGILLHPWLRENPTPSVPSGSHLWRTDQVVPSGPGLEEGEREAGLYG